MKAKFSQNHGDDPMRQLNLEEIGADLAEESNHYASATEDLPDVTGSEMAMQLDKMLSTDTLKFYLEQGDYGRGFLSGVAIGVFALELALDRKREALTETAGGDEDAVNDDDIEDVILKGLKGGLRGGGPEDGESVN